MRELFMSLVSLCRACCQRTLTTQQAPGWAVSTRWGPWRTLTTSTCLRQALPVTNPTHLMLPKHEGSVLRVLWQALFYA